MLASATASMQTLARMGPEVILPPVLHELAFSGASGTTAMLRAAAVPPTALYTALQSLGKSAAGAPVAVGVTDLAPFGLDFDALQQALAGAPLEAAANVAAAALVLPLPLPDGSIERFKIVEAPIMEPGLAAQFPDIKTYRGVGVDEPTAALRLDYTPLGFHAQVLSTRGTFYIDPYFRNDADGAYASYYRRDLTNANAFSCQVLGADDAETSEGSLDAIFADALPADALPAPITYGTQLRTFRAAVAADGEYTQAVGGGTVEGGQAAVVTAMNRVNGVYETELAVRLTLVANNSSLIYTNPGTDPYVNDTDDIDLNTPNINSVIGSANYDIGHVFTTASGGVAYLGVVGDVTYKGGGTTGIANPIDDAFYIDYVAHEIGHQFGANHTFNTSQDPNREAAVAYEPGSGSTIMAYAGIEDTEDLQDHSDPYFHSASIDEIRTFLGTIPSVGTTTATGNTPPTVIAGSNYTIPTGTPFVLTASGSDPDAGDTVTYEWQERDLGAARLLTSADNGSSPLFRDYVPSTSPSRMLPKLSTVLAGLSNTPAPYSSGAVERLFTTGRTSSWRVIARDNKPGGGGVSTADMTLTVVNTGSAFAVTAPNTNVTWGGGSTQTVTWNVAGTTGSGINVANVKISLSTDGGNTFPIVLAASTANDGSQAITVPTGFNLSNARVKVEAIGNIFFDIGNVDFTLLPDNNGQISGQVFEDRNSNGLFDGNDVASNGVTVFLDNNNNTILDGGDTSAVTSGAGNYSFPSLVADTYHLREVIPAGYIAIAPTGGAVDLAISGGVTTQNFANFPIVHTGTASADNYELRIPTVVPPVYSDNFNRATLAGGTYSYAGTVTGGGGTFGIVASDILQLSSGSANGVVYTTTPTSAFSGFNQKLSLNTGLLTWTFNMQQIRPDPGGLTAGAYGAAYILGASNGNFSTGGGTGYAITIGQSGTVDPITLRKFSAGINTSTPIATFTTTTSNKNHYWSIKVTYNPADDQWSLFCRDDGASAFVNPLAGGAYSAGGTVIDSTYTSTNLTQTGAYWSYANGTAQTAKFDNISLGLPTAATSQAEILVGGVVTYQIDKPLLPSLSFNLGGGDDSLIVNYNGGNPIPTGGAFYDGGAGANDTLTITGSGGADSVNLANAFAGPTAGNININDALTGAQTVEGVTFNGGVGNDLLTVVSAPASAITFNGGLTPTDTDRLSLNAGSHTFNSDFGATTANMELVLNNAGTSATLGSSQHLSLLSMTNGTVTLGQNGSRLINTDLLFVGANAKLDLKDNDMIVRSGVIGTWNGSNYSGMIGDVKRGYNGGAWDGNGIVTSMTAATASRARATLGVALAQDALSIGSLATATWNSETVTGTSVLVKYTHAGDFTLDGTINGDDYAMIDAGFSALASGYVRGDITLDGKVNADDYFWMDLDYSSKGSQL